MSLKLFEPKPLPLYLKDDSHEFKPILAEIEDEPVSPLGKSVFWIVILTFGFFIAWTIWGQMDIVVTAHGKVAPIGNVKVLQPLSTGVVRQINVKEGDYVKKGQVLLTIDPASTEPTLESSKQNLRYLEAERSRLNAVNGNGAGSGGITYRTQKALLDAENQKLEKQISSKEANIRTLNSKILETQVEITHTRADLEIQQDRLKHLEEVKDLITRDQFQDVENKVLEDMAKLKSLDYELEQLHHQISQTEEDISVIQQSFKTDTLTDLSDKEKRITELKANVAQLTFQNSHQQIISPVNGYVHELFVHTVGGVVTPAEKLVSVVPANAPLKIEALVDSRDIGYVKKGLPVIIKVDTFDFQKYGTLKGKVLNLPNGVYVSDDPRLPSKEGPPQYMIDVLPLQRIIKVDGKPEMLTNGLSVTAEVKVGKRRIIEFFIYPLIKNWTEGLSVR